MQVGQRSATYPRMNVIVMVIIGISLKAHSVKFVQVKKRREIYIFFHSYEKKLSCLELKSSQKISLFSLCKHYIYI